MEWLEKQSQSHGTEWAAASSHALRSWVRHAVTQMGVSYVMQSLVSSKQTKINFGSNRNKAKQDLFRVCFGLFREQKIKNSVCFGVSNLYRNNRNKQNCFVTNRNNPKFSEKYPNILSFKLFGWVFCLFRFNRNIETLCFGIEAKNRNKLFRNTMKKTKKKGKTRKKSEKP